jgi:TonB family protein
VKRVATGRVLLAASGWALLGCGLPAWPAAGQEATVASFAGSMDYPAKARREEREGAVRVALNIDASGKVSQCTVLKLSDWQDLDQAACDVWRTLVRFNPAKQDGKPVASISRQVTIWRLDDAARATPEFAAKPNYSGHRVDFTFDQDGAIANCVVQPLPAAARLASTGAGDCQRFANRAVVERLLGRSSAGFESASLLLFRIG